MELFRGKGEGLIECPRSRTAIPGVGCTAIVVVSSKLCSVRELNTATVVGV